MLAKYFKSIVDSDDKAIVVCNIEHKIIYMNPAALKRYEKRGNIIGNNLLDCHNPQSRLTITANLERMKADETVNKIFETHFTKNGANDDVFMVALRDSDGELIGYYEKFEDRNPYSAEGE